MITVGIIGATGYAGNELVRLLLRHGGVEIKWLYSRSEGGRRYYEIYRNYFELIDASLTGEELEEKCRQVDLVFSAAPQGFLSNLLTRELMESARVIDLSADYRLKDLSVYEKWYRLKHGSPELLPDAVYGLSEIYRDEIRSCRILANPGCFTTCSILTAWPLVKDRLIDPKTLIINALSGVSGAGRGAKQANLFCELNENAHAYGVTTHRHTPEIEEQLNRAYGGEPFTLNFTPHIIPMNRGILSTITADLVPGVTEEEIEASYRKYFGSEYFIRLLPKGEYPETRFVEGSNFLDIGYCPDDRTGRVVMMGAIDNLVKGAAGQAVQNMNLMFGFEEKQGIDHVPMMP